MLTFKRILAESTCIAIYGHKTKGVRCSKRGYPNIIIATKAANITTEKK